MEFIPVAMAGALLWKVIDVLKNLRAQNWNTVVTQLVAWGAGVAVLFLVASTQFAAEITVGKLNLDGLDGSTKFFVGLMLSSIVSVSVDVKKAIDGSDSSKQPSLLPPSSPSE